jgi:hypothetical protein
MLQIHHFWLLMDKFKSELSSQTKNYLNDLPHRKIAETGGCEELNVAWIY